MSELYRPSNGTEGMMFMEQFCENCIHDDYENGKFCDILSRSLAYDVESSHYPKEWVWVDGIRKPGISYWKGEQTAVCTQYEERKLCK